MQVRTGIKLQEVLSNGQDGVRYVRFLEDDQAPAPVVMLCLEVPDRGVAG